MESKRKKYPARISLIIMILCLGILFLLQNDGFKIANAVDQEGWKFENEASLANCRYGVSSGEGTSWVIADTGAGIFYKFNHPKWFAPMPENDAEFIHMIRTKQKKTDEGEYLADWYTNVPLDQELADLISNNPGDLWIVGNEIERGPNPGDINPKNLATDDIHADIYVEAYHDVYNFIKSIDPTARVANAGLIQITPMRLQYLDMMWDSYLEKYGEPIPVDIWTIHTYVLPELDKNGQPNNIASVALGTDPELGKLASGGDSSLCPDDDVYCLAEHDNLSIFAEQVVTMRQWMKERGQQEKPLIITEYGTLYPFHTNSGVCNGLKDEFGNCFTNERVSQFMVGSFDYLNQAKDPDLGYSLDNHMLVQQWIWFSALSSNGNSGNLLKNNGNQYNGVGETFKSHIQNEPIYRNLFLQSVSGNQVSQDPDGTSTARLSITFRNNGNVAVDKPFDITFYRDAALTQPIASETISGLVRGCATRSYTAEVEWSGLSEGSHPFWVKLDSNNSILEQPANDNDNIRSGQVIINDAPLYQLDVQIENLGIGTGGTVNVSPDLAAYPEGTDVTLQANPFAGWHFETWEGAATGSEPIKMLTMTDDAEVIAIFSQEQYELDIKVVGQGNVTINPNKESYLYGERVSLFAQPADNWYFASWIGDNNEKAPFIQLTLEGDISITADFKELPVGGKSYLPIIFNDS